MPRAPGLSSDAQAKRLKPRPNCADGALVRGHRRLAVRALLATAALLACAREPEVAWPPGTLLVAETPALAGFLDAVTKLERTPLARAAGALRARLPRCELVEAQSAAGDLEALAASLRCADPQGPLAPLHAARGEHAVAFALPGDPDARAVGTADLDNAAARIALRWPGAAETLAGFAPGDDPAGPDRLSAAERVAHGTLRSAGPFDLAALVPEGSQGDRLFRLRSDLFGAALLDGRVELALYQPLERAAMPRAALALGVRSDGAARAAADRFLASIEASWSLRRAPVAVGDLRGACLPDLHLAPELAPCYAIGDGALVVAWNEVSLRHAIGSEASASPAGTVTGGASARFDVDLSAVSAADARLAATLGLPPLAQHWPWRRIRATAEPARGALQIQIELEPGQAS